MWWCALALAQTPDLDWKTIRTEHFRVHYPGEAAAWAEAAAGQIEALHARVVDEVGYLPPQVIDVVVQDPYSVANGMALPLLGAPRMALWTSPPEASSVIGNRRAWDELLLVHEDTHLVHMLRPSRNQLTNAMDALLGWGPVTRKSPAWVIEGYATVVEGRLTGSGRPNGSYRLGLLAALGRDGRLPSYGELNGSGQYDAGSYRYLVGSAFLEWLETEVAPQVGASDHPLRDLWARMTAKKRRGFDEAFRGVFRDSPSVLYAQFKARMEALGVLAVRDQDWEFLNHRWGTSRPTISADGKRIAAVLSERRGPPSLVVWETAFNREAEEKWEERADEIARADPDDVRAVRPWAFAPKEVARTRRWIGAPNEPVFEPGGTLLYSAWTRDDTQRWRADLYRWDPEEDRSWRITRGADLRAPDLSDDGTWAAAVRSRWGVTEIVRVDLVTGEVRTWIASEAGVDVDGPRVGPGGRLAWLESRGQGWTPVIEGVGALNVHDVIDLSWSEQGELFGVCGQGIGFDACQLTPEPVMVTRHGAVLGLDLAPSGTLYFAARDGDGIDLRTFQPTPRPFAPRSPPDQEFPAPVAHVTVDARNYGAGPMDASPLLAGAFSQIANTSEYGVRLGDPVGRWEVLAAAAIGDPEAVSGGGIQATWRGLVPEVLASGWTTRGSGPLGPEWTSGGWLGIRGETASPAARLAAEIGVAGEQRLDGVAQAAFATAEVAWGVVEPRRVGIGCYGRIHGQGGASGQPFSLLAGDSRLSLGQAWGLDLIYGAGISAGPRRFSLGGVSTGVVAPADRWSILVAPAYPPQFAMGRLHDRQELALITPWMTAFVQRWRVADTLGRHGSTLVGLKADGSSQRQPFARFAAFETEFGVGMRVEDPSTGWLARAPVWGDLAAWGMLRWTL